jgi:hypothetical protein
MTWRWKYGDLRPVEQRLIAAAKNGEPVDLRDKQGAFNVPGEGAGWSAERTIRAEVIAGLCTSLTEDSVRRKGVRVLGAKIVGSLDLEAATLMRPLKLVHCWFEQEINLRDAQTKTIHLSGSFVPGIQADRASIGGSIFLDDGFESDGKISMVDARVTGSILATNAKFKSSTGEAFEGNRLSVEGSVFLRNFSSEGQIYLIDAKIGGSLLCGKCHMKAGQAKESRALNANRLSVGGVIRFTNGFSSEGEINLIDAKVGKSFICQNGRVQARSDGESGAVVADRFSVGGNVVFGDSLFSKGKISLNGGNVGGNIIFEDGFSLEGKISLNDTKIGGNLKCENCRIRAPASEALVGNRLRTKGSVFFMGGVCVTGEVSLFGAQIEGSFECEESRFRNRRGVALRGDGMIVGSRMAFRDGFKANGMIKIPNAKLAACYIARKARSSAVSRSHRETVLKASLLAKQPRAAVLHSAARNQKG